MRFSIVSDFSSGLIDYQEQFNVETDIIGLILLRIGKGKERIGKLPTYFQPNDSPFLKIELCDGSDNNFWTASYGQFLLIGSQTNVSSEIPKKGHYIGEKFGVGIVFYIDDSGNH